MLAKFEPLLTPQKGLVRKMVFREASIPFKGNFFYFQINLFLTFSIRYPLFRAYFTSFTKLEETMEQLGLISLDTLPPKIKYGLLFEHLPALCLREKVRGRRPFPRDALLKAFIYKALRRVNTLTDLTFELQSNPSICQAVGLNPYRTPPSIERYSEFLHATPHPILQDIRNQLGQSLVDEKAILGKYLLMDSCPIVVKARENNLKTSVSHRFDKTRSLKADPDARLGILIHFPQPFKREVHYFWGYRNHVVIDVPTELPLFQRTLPADKSEISQAIFMLKTLQKENSFNIEAVTGDAIYDSEDILKFIVKELKAKAVIPRNPRNKQKGEFYFKQRRLYCPADIPMMKKGKMTVKGITYLQYRCPIHWSKKIGQRYLLCPANHPKFFSQKGCNYLIRLTPSIREEIDYETEDFKSIYNKRTSIERVFSRLLSIAMQNPTVIGLNATQNHCTIAHITALLVALTAQRTGQKDKIRFVKSFVPNFLGT